MSRIVVKMQQIIKMRQLDLVVRIFDSILHQNEVTWEPTSIGINAFLIYISIKYKNKFDPNSIFSLLKDIREIVTPRISWPLEFAALIHLNVHLSDQPQQML